MIDIKLQLLAAKILLDGYEENIELSQISEGRKTEGYLIYKKVNNRRYRSRRVEWTSDSIEARRQLDFLLMHFMKDGYRLVFTCNKQCTITPRDQMINFINKCLEIEYNSILKDLRKDTSKDLSDSIAYHFQ